MDRKKRENKKRGREWAGPSLAAGGARSAPGLGWVGRGRSVTVFGRSAMWKVMQASSSGTLYQVDVRVVALAPAVARVQRMSCLLCKVVPWWVTKLLSTSSWGRGVTSAGAAAPGLGGAHARGHLSGTASVPQEGRDIRMPVVTRDGTRCLAITILLVNRSAATVQQEGRGL